MTYKYFSEAEILDICIEVRNLMLKLIKNKTTKDEDLSSLMMDISSIIRIHIAKTIFSINSDILPEKSLEYMYKELDIINLKKSNQIEELCISILPKPK